MLNRVQQNMFAEQAVQQWAGPCESYAQDCFRLVVNCADSGSQQKMFRRHRILFRLRIHYPQVKDIWTNFDRLRNYTARFRSRASFVKTVQRGALLWKQ